MSQKLKRTKKDKQHKLNMTLRSQARMLLLEGGQDMSRASPRALVGIGKNVHMSIMMLH